MASRLEFSEALHKICDNVYFQPPESKKINYPCIIYERRNIDQQFADNIPYAQKTRYTVTVISRDPDDPIVDAVSQFPYCLYDRFYTADNLNHDVFNIYY